ncbi:abortive infection family protein [Stigmatella hybrida]|uniref:abortive infection family protein n=1 Tax=Stigmatella hybrida TaxID=394097 RepID=UPI001CDB0C6E|nr:abortive infection family protein [Stigmatella hybrida]
MLHGSSLSAEELEVAQPQIPEAVCVVVGDVLGNFFYHYQTIDATFVEAGAHMPPPAGNCVARCRGWLSRSNTEHRTPLEVLGKVLRKLMDLDHSSSTDRKYQQRVQDILAQHGMRYEQGGRILPSVGSLPTRDLAAKLRERDLAGVEEDFTRALDTVRTDPRSAVTAACSILEATFKTYLEEEGQPLPPDKSVMPLWKAVQRHMKLTPDEMQNDDLRKVVSGLSSVVDGIGAFRTHAGSAHGGSRSRRAPEEYEARFAVHAAHSVVAFILDKWAHQQAQA